MWIGVVADTDRGELHEDVPRVLDGMDFIIHCGGIGPSTVLDELSTISPTTGVLGKHDAQDEFPYLESILTREMGGVTLLVTHFIGHPTRPTSEIRGLLEQVNPKVLLFGSTGEPFNTAIENRLWFNPGRGARSGRGTTTVGILEIDGQSVRGEIVTVGE